MKTDELLDREDTVVYDERDFKLKRFVKDVNKFYNNCVSQGSGNKYTERRKIEYGRSRHYRKDKRGLYQNGVLTRNFTRGNLGLRDAHNNARIDEDLHTLIKLANKSKSSDGVDAESNIQCQLQDKIMEAKTIVQNPTIKWTCPDFLDKENYMKHSANLDDELYTDFVRAVNQSLILEKESKFTNKYHSKRTKMYLVQAFLKWAKTDQSIHKKPFPFFENNNVSGIGLNSITGNTSALLQETHPNYCREDDQQKRKEKKTYKTTKEFIKETLGPGVSFNPTNAIFYKNYSHCFHNSKPHLKDTNVNNPSFSQSSVSSESGVSALHHSQSVTTTDHHSTMRHTYSPKVSDSFLLYKKLSYQNMQYLSTSFNAANHVSSSRKSFQNQIAGGFRDILCNPSSETLLPFMLRECSPEFRYYPQRMF